MAGSKKHGERPAGDSRDAAPRPPSTGETKEPATPLSDRQPSMGGSQGTRAEAQERARRNMSSETSREEGGYGADSGYSDAVAKSGSDKPETNPDHPNKGANR